MVGRCSFRCDLLGGAAVDAEEPLGGQGNYNWLQSILSPVITGLEAEVDLSYKDPGPTDKGPVFVTNPYLTLGTLEARLKELWPSTKI